MGYQKVINQWVHIDLVRELVELSRLLLLNYYSEILKIDNDIDLQENMHVLHIDTCQRRKEKIWKFAQC